MCYTRRGRGSYRGRGRGNYYRMDRNSTQQHHPHLPSTAPQHSNMPYYDQSMNLMNSGMASGQGGYNDAAYHDTQQNRYDRIYTFSLNSTLQPITSNGFVKYVGQRHSIQYLFQLVININYIFQIISIFLHKTCVPVNVKT